MINLYECIQKHSTCYLNTETMTVLGVLWHSTGCNNPTLKRYVQPYEDEPNYDKDISKLGKNNNKNDWNHVRTNAGLNAWIGKFADGSVGTVQTMPWNYRPWGCSSGLKGSCNNGWIQFEICEDALNDKDYAQKVWDEAIELSVYLCKMFNLNPLGTAKCGSAIVPVITCHNDASKLGVGSNHADINHWFPKLLGKSMEDARKEIAAKLNTNLATIPVASIPTTSKSELYRVRKSWDDTKSQLGAFKILDNAKKACKEGYSVYDSKGNVVYSINSQSPAKKTLDQLAKEVINGEWGNGEDRKNRLTAAGYEYNLVQSEVNSILSSKVKYVSAVSGLWLHNRATTSASTRVICIPYKTEFRVKHSSGSMSFGSCTVNGTNYSGYVASSYLR